MSSELSVDDRLQAVIDNWAFPIHPNCKQDLERLVRDSAARPPGLDWDSQKMEEAETNLRALLTEMTWQAGTMGLTELHESTLAGALAKLCPLFPFC